MVMIFLFQLVMHMALISDIKIFKRAYSQIVFTNNSFVFYHEMV